MKESVELREAPELMRNSLILIGLTLRTFSAVVSLCFSPLAFVHRALPTKSPLKGDRPDFTLNVALTLAPGATGSENVFDVPLPPATCEVQPLPGREMLSVTFAAGAPVVFVKLNAVSCEDPGVKVWSPGGVAVAEAGAKVSGCTSYFAATTLACTSWSVASVGNVFAAVTAPS